MLNSTARLLTTMRLAVKAIPLPQRTTFGAGGVQPARTEVLRTLSGLGYRRGNIRVLELDCPFISDTRGVAGNGTACGIQASSTDHSVQHSAASRPDHCIPRHTAGDFGFEPVQCPSTSGVLLLYGGQLHPAAVPPLPYYLGAGGLHGLFNPRVFIAYFPPQVDFTAGLTVSITGLHQRAESRTSRNHSRGAVIRSRRSRSGADSTSNKLLTKAYELFKRFRSGQSRQTFYIACRIAETYHTSGKYDAAIRYEYPVTVYSVMLSTFQILRAHRTDVQAGALGFHAANRSPNVV